MRERFAIRMPNGKLWGEYGALLSTYQYMKPCGEHRPGTNAWQQ